MEKILFDYIEKYITLSDEEKQAIIDLSVFKSFEKDAILLREGQVSNESFFVVKGCIRCYYMIDGEEKTTAFYTEGEIFAPLCSVTGEPSEYFVACVEDTILAVSTPEIEQISFEKFPRFESLCRMISEEKVARNQATFDEFKTSSPEQRYLTLIETRYDLVQRVPQYQLASFLGITPQSLSRMRARLQKRPDEIPEVNQSYATN
jgi:CRP-like cAMP-binding protein